MLPTPIPHQAAHSLPADTLKQWRSSFHVLSFCSHAGLLLKPHVGFSYRQVNSDPCGLSYKLLLKTLVNKQRYRPIFFTLRVLQSPIRTALQACSCLTNEQKTPKPIVKFLRIPESWSSKRALVRHGERLGGDCRWETRRHAALRRHLAAPQLRVSVAQTQGAGRYLP